MTTLMDEAIASLRRNVSPEHRDEIARTVLRLTGRDRSVYVLTPEERDDLDAADAEIARGEVATADEVRELYAFREIGSGSYRAQTEPIQSRGFRIMGRTRRDKCLHIGLSLRLTFRS